MFRRPLLICLAAGLLSATGFAPLQWWPVLLACLAVLLGQVWHAPTLRAALLRGWVFGVGHFTIGNNWIQHAFDFQDKMPPALGYFAVALLALYLAVYPAMAMGLAWRFDRAVRSRAGWHEPDLAFVLVAGAAWIVTEWLRSVLFTGYPWNPLGVAWLDTWLALSGAWIGTYALSGMMMVAAGALFLASHRNYGAGAAILLLLALLTLANLHGAGKHDRDVTVRVVQPNIGQEGVSEPAYAWRVLDKLIALSGRPAPGAPPRLLVWPEGMVNQFIEDGYPAQWYYQGDPRQIRAAIAATLGPRDVALIGGNALFFNARKRVSGVGNSVWVLDSAGMLRSRYDKAHLVPYGEYLPMRDILGPLGLARLVMGEVDFVPGPGPHALDAPGFGKAGIQICYEIIFSGQVVDRRQRPDFLFNPSNDAWFGSWGPPQHLAQARMRAIEEGLPILRATPTGISAVIDGAGALRGTIAMGREGVIDARLPPPLPPTLFSRLGNTLAFLTGTILLLIAIAFRRFAR